MQLAKHTQCILSWTAAGRQGRSEEGWRVGGRQQAEGGRVGAREVREGGSDDVR